MTNTPLEVLSAILIPAALFFVTLGFHGHYSQQCLVNKTQLDNLKPLSPTEYPEQCIELADWFDSDDALAAYRRKLAGRIPVLAEYTAAKSWVRYGMQERQRQAEARAACKRLTQPSEQVAATE